MKKMFRYAVALLLSVLIFSSCEDKDGSKGGESNYFNVNQRMYLFMDSYYLWNQHFPSKIVVPNTDPYDFFDDLCYSEDKWSVLVNEASDLIGSMTNESKSFGWGIQGFVNPAGNEIWAAVLYVHEDTPAAKAGIKRGDIIKRIGGRPMTQDGSAYDWRQLFGTSNISVTVTNTSGTKDHSLTAASSYLDPVIEYKVFEKGSKKIGYLLYSDFVSQSEDALKNEVFGYFKNDKQITDLIVDLRYNGGGTTTTSQLLASLIAPKQYLDGKSVFSKMVFNSYYMGLLENEGPGVLEEETMEYLLSLSEVPNNLDLSKVYFLTGSGTASASEQTMVGLMPYMDVYSVGNKTHGKFVGGSVYPAKVTNGQLVPDRSTPMKDWCMYIMMFMYSNKNGYPDKNEGLAPTKSVTEDWNFLKPVGDETDPAIANAINHIVNGVWLPATYSTRASEVTVIGDAMTPGVPRGVLYREMPAGLMVKE